MNVCITYRFLNLQWNGKLLVTLFNEGTKNAVQRNRRPTGILWQPKSRDIFAASYCELKYSLRIWSDGTGSLYTSLLTVSRSGLFCLLWRKRPQPTPIQWDLEDRYSTPNHNFSSFYISFLPPCSPGLNNDGLHNRKQQHCVPRGHWWPYEGGHGLLGRLNCSKNRRRANHDEVAPAKTKTPV